MSRLTIDVEDWPAEHLAELVRTVAYSCKGLRVTSGQGIEFRGQDSAPETDGDSGAEHLGDDVAKLPAFLNEPEAEGVDPDDTSRATPDDQVAEKLEESVRRATRPFDWPRSALFSRGGA